MSKRTNFFFRRDGVAFIRSDIWLDPRFRNNLSDGARLLWLFTRTMTGSGEAFPLTQSFARQLRALNELRASRLVTLRRER